MTTIDEIAQGNKIQQPLRSLCLKRVIAELKYFRKFGKATMTRLNGSGGFN